MSLSAVIDILERVSTDAGFRDQMRDQPERALEEYDLSQQEREALVRQDSGALHSMGVDSRITKASWGAD